MPAFVKRRWFSSLCVLIFAGFSVVNGRIGWRSTTGQSVFLEAENGRLIFAAGEFWDIEPAARFFHSPMMGFNFLPEAAVNGSGFGTSLPIWLLLGGTIGWIVLRELRWREKPKKAMDAKQ